MATAHCVGDMALVTENASGNKQHAQPMSACQWNPALLSSPIPRSSCKVAFALARDAVADCQGCPLTSWWRLDYRVTPSLVLPHDAAACRHLMVPLGIAAEATVYLACVDVNVGKPTPLGVAE